MKSWEQKVLAKRKPIKSQQWPNSFIALLNVY